LVLVARNLHWVQLLAPKVVVELAVEAAGVVPVLLSVVSLMLMAHQEALSQSMPRVMVAQDMMISQ
jgi:hypothetical protein